MWMSGERARERGEAGNEAAGPRPFQECDFLIVGAGSAGCVLASRLSENPAHRVILLEAGGRDNDPLLKVPAAVGRNVEAPQHNWNYYSEPEPELDGRRVFCARGKVLGGSS